jgi:AcrR family transcriptional regulator
MTKLKRAPTPRRPLPDEREPRGARRKRETRARLLDAAFQLMATRGIDAVAIAEITEAADVGAGSFYNHFDSKEAIYAAVVDGVFEEFGKTLDDLVKSVSDPAEVIAVCVRHTIRRAGREPVWGQFLIREGLSGQAITRGLGLRLWRDMQLGIQAGRLKVADPLMTFLAIGGAVLGAVSAEAQMRDRGSPQAALAKQLGLHASDIPERCAAVLLHALGLSVEQSEKVARRPLPEVPNLSVRAWG